MAIAEAENSSSTLKQMSANRWQQIEEIFQSALDLAPAERLRFVAEHSAGDIELKQEVEKLLKERY